MDDTGAWDALFHEGVRLMRAGDHAAAADAFRAALVLAPWMVAAHVNLGLLMARAANPGDAEHHYRTALSLDPAHFHARVHLGVLLASQKRFSEAEGLYRAALATDPVSPAALSNLGVLLACTSREDDAEACYRTALAHDPAYANASFNLAYILLRQGRFDEGWAAFEARGGYAHLTRYFQCPRWHGAPLAGKSLIIGFEGGHGDMLQFARYATVARDLGAAHVAIVCHPALKTLFTRLDGVDTVYGYDEDVPASGWDFWTPPMSFPWVLGPGTMPASLPYLHADPDKVKQAAAIVTDQRLRVGLAWQGNPQFENDADRSLASIDVLAPLFDVAGVAYFSLQKGPGQLVSPAFTVADLTPHLRDFDDTAAFIMQLDLVITVDSAVAHLAGALGKPCWLMLPAFKTDWRWRTGRTDSAWYPAVMRLFWQEVAGDWGGVVLQMRAALLEDVARLRDGAS